MSERNVLKHDRLLLLLLLLPSGMQSRQYPIVPLSIIDRRQLPFIFNSFTGY
jgi:hypothetical protein